MLRSKHNVSCFDLPYILVFQSLGLFSRELLIFGIITDIGIRFYLVLVVKVIDLDWVVRWP